MPRHRLANPSPAVDGPRQHNARAHPRDAANRINLSGRASLGLGGRRIDLDAGAHGGGQGDLAHIATP